MIIDKLNDWEKLTLHCTTSLTMSNQFHLKCNQDQERNKFLPIYRVLCKMSLLSGMQGWGDLYYRRAKNAILDLEPGVFYQPRAQVIFKPSALHGDITFRVAAGMYYQPPFTVRCGTAL